MDITVKISRHGRYIKHSFSRGKPVAFDVIGEMGNDTYHIVLGAEAKRAYQDDIKQSRKTEHEAAIRAEIAESRENVNWLRD